MPEFTWDPDKAAQNLRKHQVAFEDAMLIWDDPHHLVLFDRVADGEERWHILGSAAGVTLLLAVHTYLNDDEDHVRIISARKATKQERRAYEHGEDH